MNDNSHISAIQGWNYRFYSLFELSNVQTRINRIGIARWVRGFGSLNSTRLLDSKSFDSPKKNCLWKSSEKLICRVVRVCETKNKPGSKPSLIFSTIYPNVQLPSWWVAFVRASQWPNTDSPQVKKQSLSRHCLYSEKNAPTAQQISFVFHSTGWKQHGKMRIYFAVPRVNRKDTFSVFSCTL